MRHQVNGTIMQTVAIELELGEQVYSQTSSMCWMSDSIEMETQSGGGFFAGLRRSLGGGSFFITEFTARAPGHISFAPRFPGAIIAKTLGESESLICRKETFLCAQKTVSLEIAWQKRLGAGFFGGEGFILQKVTGPGVVWLDLSGEVVEKELAPGEKLLVHAGHVGAQTPDVEFDIQMVRGFSNILFGGEGLFLATLTGPGHVWLQSMPIMNLAEEVGRYLPRAAESGAFHAVHAAAVVPAVAPVVEATASAADSVVDVATGMVGGILNGLFGDDETKT